ncbi:hypothetical protein FRB90_012802 [Tulasnella sp. 427]|nr:hypothetical protein FRB90_012802 [Tulasnella sp. 427]
MSYKWTPPLDETTIGLLYGKDTKYNAEIHSEYQVIVLNKQKRAPILTGILPTVLVVFLSAGLGAFLIAWLLIHQAHGLPGYSPGFLGAVRNGTFVVDEGYKESGDVIQASLIALTFSAVASHMIGLTSSFLMTLVAYRTASQWLKHSQRPLENAERQGPTPIQYGLLLGLLGTSNVMSVWKSIRYALRSKAQRSKLPSIFIEPLIIASIVLILNHALGASDLWLHATARSALITVTIAGDVQDQSGLKLGVAFNESLCDPHMRWCLQYAHGWSVGPDDGLVSRGWQVNFNSTSAPFRVVTLTDQNSTAVMVPTGIQSLSSMSTSYVFTAPTLGIRSKCQILTTACATDAVGTVTDCTPAGAPYLPLKFENISGSDMRDCRFPNRVFGVLEGHTGYFIHALQQEFPDNYTFPDGPATIGIQLSLDSEYSFLSSPPPSADSASRLYATCQIDLLNGTLTYDPSENKYKLINEAYFPGHLTPTLLGPMTSQFGTDAFRAGIAVPIMVDPTIDPPLLLNANLPRIALGLLGGVVKPVAAAQVSQVRQGVFGLYPVAPVLCVSGILFAYALFAMFIFLTSVSSTSYTVSTTASLRQSKMEIDHTPQIGDGKEQTTREETALLLGQLWLTDPLPLVASVFGGRDGMDHRRSITGEALDMVYDMDGKAGRLVLGVAADGDESKFSLKRRERNFRGSFETF